MDIVTALRRMVTADFREAPRIYVSPMQAADEIERLRGLLAGIHKAVTDEGRSPAYHQQVMSRHRKEWSVLWQAIDKAMKGLTDGH